MDPEVHRNSGLGDHHEGDPLLLGAHKLVQGGQEHTYLACQNMSSQYLHDLVSHLFPSVCALLLYLGERLKKGGLDWSSVI